jgi:hypothetical protein
MAQTIKLKRSATQNAVPSTSSLALGEIALNTYDGKLFIKKDVGGTESIVTIGAVGAGSIGPTELASTAVTAGSYGSTSAIPVITIDADGRITSASTATISGLSANSVTSTEIAANAVGISELDVTDGTDGQVLTTDGSGTLTFETPTGGAASANAFATNIASGDGSTATFTLSSTPSAESKIIAFINGVFQNQDAYTISGTDITFDTAPISGTNNVVVYVIGDVYSGESVLISNFDGNGSTTAFTLSNNPGNENNTQVYIDGVYQQKTTYSVSGTTLTFNTAPPTGTANIEVVMLTSTTVNTPAAGSVVTASMADDSVTGAKIVSSAVTTAKIADANVTTAKIADANVTTAKIANDAVTLDKIADAVFVTESEGISSNDNDTTLPTSAAVKDYVDGKDFETGLAGDSGTGTVNTSQTLTFSGTTNEVNTSVSGQTVTVGLPNSVNLTSNLTVGGYIAGPASFTIDPAGVGDNTGTVVIAGNLQVDGTQTIINSTSMSVDDLNLTLASGAANAAAANGAGLTIDGASATLLYASSGDKFVFNKTVDATIGTAAQPNITSVGTLTSLNASGSVKLDKSFASSDFLGDANIYSLRLTNDNTTAGNVVGLSFGQGGYNFTNFIASVRTGTGANPKGDLVFGGRPSDGSAFVERMRIQANGHVGIGTDNPGYALTISNTTSGKLSLAGGTNQNGIRFEAAGNDGVSSSLYYLGAGSDLMSGTDYGAVFLDVTNNRSVLYDDQSNSRLGFYNNNMVIDASGNVGIKRTSIAQPSAGATTLAIQGTDNNKAGAIRLYSANDSVAAYIYPDSVNGLSINTSTSHPMVFRTAGVERLKIGSDGLAEFTSTRNEWAMRLTSGSNRGGIVLDKPGTSTIMGSMLMLASDETFRLGTASNYHIRMTQNGSTFFGDTANTHFSSSGNLYMGTTTNFIAYNTIPGSQWTTIAESINYGSHGYSSSQRYWHHLKSAGGTHITVNTDGAVTASENAFDDFVVWQGTQDSGEPLFRVSNAGRVIAKRNYEIGNHKTNKEEFGVSAINTVDTATSDINTTTTNTYENRPGVYWLNYNSKRFRAFIKPNWLQNRNWVLAAKFFHHSDMPAGSSLWTNDASWNAGDFDLNNGHFSKYGMPWRYFGFTRLAMQMGDRIAPIMQFNSTQTLYGAFSGGLANNSGITADSTDPAMTGTGVTYHNMTNYAGPDFTDLGGLEDRMQSYGLNKWMGSSTNSTSSNNQSSFNKNGTVKGHQLTVEDSHPNIGGNVALGRAGAWIGCPLDEGGSTQGNATGNGGADSAFGFGGGCGNNARTWTSGIAEWGRGNEVANYHPAYIWLSID